MFHSITPFADDFYYTEFLDKNQEHIFFVNKFLTQFHFSSSSGIIGAFNG